VTALGFADVQAYLVDRVVQDAVGQPVGVLGGGQQPHEVDHVT
jgi:hypothetical protein